MKRSKSFIYYLTIIIILLFFNLCNYEKKNKNTYSELIPIEVKYAKGFKLFVNNSEKIIEIYNPWQKANNAEFKYRLSIKKQKDKNCINIPVKRIICLSTTHLAFIEKLGKTEAIKGLSGKNYINSKIYASLIEEGKILDIGYEQNLNYELIISLKPDIIFAYSVGSENTGFINKFKEFKIPLVFIGDYLEEHPLGKAEWIKVFGLFLNNYSYSDSVFQEIEKEYISAKKIVENIKIKPKVMTGLLWNDTWFVPGGNSYLANFIKDAGGNYIWSNNKLNRSISLSLEKILIDSQEADYWIHPGSANTIKEIINLDSRLNNIKPLKNDMVYNNNARENEAGGNDYWETGVVNPHILLKDLISIFHNELLPGYQLQYYKKLE